ncbi:MAG: glycosyltransferase family 39 protein [Armatimonadetes bacterium]|nr:glycosyltransferase family 39 protein [Armatimonadota bacterium]
MTDTEPIPLSLNAARFFNRAAFVLLFALLVIRLVTATHFGLAWDEAYYWQWSRYLAFGYYDAGPGIALTIRAGTLLFGDTPLGVRFVPILLSVAANALIFALARRLFDARVGFWTIALAAVSPLLAIGSVLATYDLPQIFFWAAGLYAVARAVEDAKPTLLIPNLQSLIPTLWWYVTGLCVGLGTNTKPTMIFFAPGVLLLLWLVPAYRKHLASPHPYLAFALAILCLAPLFIWNAQHDNVNWIHTLNRGNRSTNAAPGRWLGEFWGGQALVVGPGLLIAELIALGYALRRTMDFASQKSVDPRYTFIAAFTVPILALCTLIALRSKVEINWCVAAHLSGLLGIAAVFTRERLRGWFVASVAVSAILSLVLFFPNALVIRPFAPLVANGTWEKVNEQYGWEVIAGAVVREKDALQAESGATPVFVAGTGYRVCSILSFYLPGQPFVPKLQIPDTRRDQYNVWTNEAALAGQNAVVALDMNRPEEEAYLRTRFASVSEPVVVDVPRPSFKGAVKSWRLYRCRGLK